MNWKQPQTDPRELANAKVAEGLVRSIHSFDLEALAHRIRQG